MDPVTTGAAKQVQQSMFEQAQQQIQKSNEQISEFEQLRQKLEQQDAISDLQQPDQIQQANKMQGVDQVNQANDVGQVQNVQNVGELKGIELPQIENMTELESMVNNIRNGQARLNQIISEAVGGKTYAPAELIAMQAEVAKISQELEMASKVVQNFVEGIKTTLNMQF